jgi:hypothetical protein
MDGHFFQVFVSPLSKCNQNGFSFGATQNDKRTESQDALTAGDLLGIAGLTDVILPFIIPPSNSRKHKGCSRSVKRQLRHRERLLTRGRPPTTFPLLFPLEEYSLETAA